MIEKTYFQKHAEKYTKELLEKCKKEKQEPSATDAIELFISTVKECLNDLDARLRKLENK